MTVANKNARIRLNSFDFMKGIGIILVVVSHSFGRYSESSSPIIGIIMTCLMASKGLMPMFFIITGYSFRETPLKKKLKKTFSELMMPYFIIMGTYAVLYPIANYSGYRSWTLAFDQAKRYVAAFLLGWTQSGETFLDYRLAWCTAAWFLLALFIAMNVLNLVLKMKKECQRAICMILCLSMSWFLAEDVSLLFCIPQGLRAACYCYVGYLIKKYGIVERIVDNAWTYVILLLIYFMEYKWGIIDMSQGIFGRPVLDFVGTSASGLLLMLISIHISRKELRGLKWCSTIGMYSYWLICIHAIEMDVLPWYFLPLSMPDHLIIAFFIEILIKIVIMTVTCILMKEIAKRRYRRRRLAAQRSASRTS